MYSCHFGNDNMIFGDFIFNPVHLYPENWYEDQEVDFYLDTGDDICLLRLRNNSKNQVTFCEGTLMYIVIEKQLDSNMPAELNGVAAGLNAIGIPDADGLKGQTSLSWPPA